MIGASYIFYLCVPFVSDHSLLILAMSPDMPMLSSVNAFLNSQILSVHILLQRMIGTVPMRGPLKHIYPRPGQP